jgi:uncharacterized membrane protein
MRMHTLYSIVMILCFIYGGISILFFLTQIMALNVEPSPIGRPPFMERMNETLALGENGSVFNATRERFVQFQGRNASYFYMVVFISLFGSAISIVSGLTIYHLLRKKDRRELTKSVIDIVTTPEEKLVLKELEESGGNMTQTELAKRTKLSKVKIHRVVKRLESIGVVSKYSYGMTNKIKLEKKVFEE